MIPPAECELMEMDLDRVHDELDRLGAPETRATMCASDWKAMLAYFDD